MRLMPKGAINAHTVTGREILARDWDGSSIGPIETWPPSLRTTLALMLDCPTPMFLAWGDDLLCFYNDAYRPVLGYRLETALGAPFRQVWSSIWDDIGPLVEATLAGQTLRQTDMKLDLARGGVPEDSWWTFTYSPARDDFGRITGLFCVTGETTAKVLAERALRESEERFRNMADHAPVMMWVTDPDGACTYLNRSWYAFTGQTEAEAVGYGWLAAVHPDDRPEAKKVFISSNARQTAFQVEYRLRRADGDYRWVIDAASPRLTADGAFAGYVGSVIDITDRKRVEDLLQSKNLALAGEVSRQTQERDRLWRLSQDPFLIADSAGVWLAVSPAWTTLLGWREDELVGRTSEWMEHPDDRAKTRGEIDQLAGGETTTRFENRFRTKAGDYRWFSWTASPAEGLLYCVARDITAEKALAGEREQLEAQLRQAQKMEAVGQLTGGLAHDFNNLLAGVIGSLELMQARIRQGRVKEIERYMGAAQAAAQRAAALTHRLLAFSRRQTLDPRPTNVNALVNGMEDLIRRTVGPAVIVETVGAVDLWTTLVDPPQLENALLNLCINARDAMPGGGRITIETANKWIDSHAARHHDMPQGQFLSLCVTDTGTGMTPEVMAKAFDPFFTTKPLGEGTGLGLSMIYGFARQSGGQVRLYSEVGKGTTVCVYLPRYLGEADDETQGAQQTPPAARVTEGQTVLVVDDEPTVRMLVTDVLEELGYRAIEAADSASGLKILQSNVRIDLLVTDVGLPGGMNGRQMADAARGSRPDLKVLFITGYAENAVIGNGHLDHGMQIITKPFNVEALTARIREMIASG